MKKSLFRSGVAIAMMSMVSFSSINAQEAAAEEAASPFNVGAAVYSSYVWRGQSLDKGPSIQPTLEFTKGGFTIGAWGAYSLTSNGLLETDLYAKYAFDFGLTLGVTDYYNPYTSRYSVLDPENGTPHVLEANLGYKIGALSLSANYTFFGDTMKVDNDLYFEAGYAFKHFNLFVGTGNGMYGSYVPTTKGDFAITNIGISSSKEIKFSDTFTLPVTGAFIVNPDLDEVFFTVGFTF